MKDFNKIIATFLTGFLFVTAISADPIIHEHFEDTHSTIECEFCENKTFDNSNTQLSIVKVYISEVKTDEIDEECFFPDFQNFQSRAPPKT